MKEDKKLIINFIYQIYDWLDSIFLEEKSDLENILSHEWPKIEIKDNVKNQAKLAWTQFKKDFPKQSFKNSISHFQKKRLISHGLYGDQLKYKLKIVEFNLKKARSMEEKWIIKFIDAIDNLFF